jgi:hypothetical protein
MPRIILFTAMLTACVASGLAGYGHGLREGETGRAVLVHELERTRWDVDELTEYVDRLENGSAYRSARFQCP